MVPSVAASVALTIADIEMFLAYRIFCTQCDFVSGFWSEKGSREGFSLKISGSQPPFKDI